MSMPLDPLGNLSLDGLDSVNGHASVVVVVSLPNGHRERDYLHAWLPYCSPNKGAHSQSD